MWNDLAIKSQHLNLRAVPIINAKTANIDEEWFFFRYTFFDEFIGSATIFISILIG